MHNVSKPPKTVCMMQTELTKRAVAQIGEAIPHELGAKMICDYRNANPSDVIGYQIGRNIIEQILSQPDCAGIRFFNAYNETGDKTLVYTGIDQYGKTLIKYSVITEDGNFNSTPAIVADRIVPPGTAGSSTLSDEGWEWYLDTLI
jgi:hypothetical protein